MPVQTVKTVQQQQSVASPPTTTTNNNSVSTAADSTQVEPPLPPPPQQQQPKSVDLKRVKHKFTLTLMAITGIQEAICMRRFGSMPTMMTGNTIRGIVALTEMDWTAAAISGSCVVSYITGGALFKSISIILSDQKKNDDSTAVRHLPIVSKVAMCLFVIADIMHYLTKSKCMLLPAMSIAYGMINTAALHETGAVTNAITGHYSTFGLGFAEHVMFQNS